jgi:hypothetical protein
MKRMNADRSSPTVTVSHQNNTIPSAKIRSIRVIRAPNVLTDQKKERRNGRVRSPAPD